MPATGEISLDISKFETALAKAVVQLGKLDKQSKLASAELAIMEQRFNEVGVASGVTERAIRKKRIELEILSKRYVETKAHVDSFNSVLEKQQGVARGILPTMSKLRTAVGLIFSGFALGGVMSFAKGLLALGTSIKEASIQTGVLAPKLQQLQGALANELNADEVSSALSELNKMIRAAASGSAEAQSKLKSFGATSKDTADVALLKFIEKLEGLDTETKKAILSTGLFGDALGLKLVPAARAGRTAIEELMKAQNILSNSNDLAQAEKKMESWWKSIKINSVQAIQGWGMFISNVSKGVENGELKKSIDERLEWLKKWSDAEFGEFPVSGGKKGGGTQMPDRVEDFARVNNGGTNDPAKAAEDVAVSNNLALESAEKLLDTQSRIASSIAPEIVKQWNLLSATEDDLVNQVNEELILRNGIETVEVKRKQLALDQVQEQKRQLVLTNQLAKSSAAVNKVRASAGMGYEEEQKVALAELADLRNQMRVADAKPDHEEKARLLAQYNEEQKAFVKRQQAHDDELRDLKAQTSEMQAQASGQALLAEQLALNAKYEAEIVKQKRLGNTEAIKQLKAQEAIENKVLQAKRNRETPRERVQSRRAARLEGVDAKQQDARDEEQRRRKFKGVGGSFALDQVSRMDKVKADRAKSVGNADQEQWKSDVASILAEMQK